MGEARTLFRPDLFDLIAGEFATNLTYYRNYTDDDVIAGMFLGCALDIIDCTYYTIAKSMPTERRRIADSFVCGWNDDVFGTRLFEDIFNPGLAQEVISQHGLLLEAMRDRYEWLIRGPLGCCWNESSASIEQGQEECHSRSRCLAGTLAEGRLGENCAGYYRAWKGTMLALDGKEDLRGKPGRLADCIRKRCRVLNLLTTPEGVAEFLEENYGEGERSRTVRGVIPRLLTMLVDESLADLSRKLALPPGEGLYFANPTA